MFWKRFSVFAAIVFFAGLSLSFNTTVSEGVDTTLMDIRKRSAVMDSPFVSFLLDYEQRLKDNLLLDKVPGAAWAIVRNGVVVSMETHGVKIAGERDSVTVNTLFRIASLSKGVTGVLAGRTVELGLLAWDSPYCTFSNKEFYTADIGEMETLELQHFLSHTTGYPRHTFSNLLNMGRSYSNILGLLPLVEQVHEPGTYHNYQNVLFNLGANMLEAASGTTFDTLADKLLFAPLNMYHASVGYEPFISAKDIAMPHRKSGQGYASTEVKPNFYEVPGAAGVNASIMDMSKWLVALTGHNPEVLSEQLLEEVLCPTVPIPAARLMHRNWKGLDGGFYGIGWRNFEIEGQRITGHSGYVNGYRAEIAFWEEQDVGIVMLTNAPNKTVGAFIPAFFERYNEQIVAP